MERKEVMITDKEIEKFLEAYEQWHAFSKQKPMINKTEAKQVGNLAIKAFFVALAKEDSQRRFELVDLVVARMQVLSRYNAAIQEFLLAKKKMTNYAVLEGLSDVSTVKFTVSDCDLLHQRYRSLKENNEVIPENKENSRH
ncbi:MAG: hypothetical protein A3I12_04310 [Gammaproteobacteria bacterium RIFCSPLOWO2_02_FULL_38_11]|nr:MAG: hypothetical protein A2W47_06835 [Gammaproteobacteria bacterium RIFCSPHIGHO2_12_38_15]OGT69233.1 MAG: hypothetical protein A3I12_04310 [Gammaproteobacteria bacterium RIFCSPLOWO2_02_FULL_38_11]OGT77943.1 MAG: hypothetical protein A3G71_02905 [Gammaproteobacteria bacterium RIFCSPLOWO2_12_FULL_38_14]